VRLIKE